MYRKISLQIKNRNNLNQLKRKFLSTYYDCPFSAVPAPRMATTANITSIYSSETLCRTLVAFLVS
jgi:hypothetical protein